MAVSLSPGTVHGWDGWWIRRRPLEVGLVPSVGGRLMSLRWRGHELSFVHPEEKEIFDELNAGGTVPFERAFPVIRRSALSLLGIDYDFEFDFLEFNSVSCTELLFYATRCLSPFLGVFPEKTRVLFFDHVGIVPDALVRSPLSVVWQSPSCDVAEIEKLREAVRPPLAATRTRAA